MHNLHQAFVSTPGFPVSTFRGARLCASRASPMPASRHTAAPARRATVVMQTTKDKKKSALTFATDIKGNIVWNLRVATDSDSDVDAIHALVEDKLPRALVAAFVKSKGTIVAEVSAKGGKEDDTFIPRIMGVALVDVMRYLRDGDEKRVDLRATFMTIAHDDELPVEGVDEKMLLAAMKTLKDDGVSVISHEVSFPERIELCKACGFSENGKNEEGLTKLRCDLILANPDPRKKIM